MSYRRRTINRSIIFPGFQDFQPNLSPRQIFEKALLVERTGEQYTHRLLKKNIATNTMTKDYETEYDVNVNTYIQI